MYNLTYQKYHKFGQFIISFTNFKPIESGKPRSPTSSFSQMPQLSFTVCVCLRPAIPPYFGVQRTDAIYDKREISLIIGCFSMSLKSKNLTTLCPLYTRSASSLQILILVFHLVYGCNDGYYVIQGDCLHQQRERFWRRFEAIRIISFLHC